MALDSLEDRRRFFLGSYAHWYTSGWADEQYAPVIKPAVDASTTTSGTPARMVSMNTFFRRPNLVFANVSIERLTAKYAIDANATTGNNASAR